MTDERFYVLLVTIGLMALVFAAAVAWRLKHDPLTMEGEPSRKQRY
ncbi:hypothetical protein [Cupriavidus taiwanensis]|nr:hypothetical protein [Cupriavidus taiwanensis]